MKSELRRIKLVLNLIIAVLVFYSWLHMVFRGGGALSSRGVSSLKYYTVLSNLFSGFTALLFLSGRCRQWIPFLKLTSSVSITLTLLTVIFFLGPLFGFAGMYAGDNLWFHLIIPLLCILDYLIAEPYHPSFARRLLTLLPTILYGIFYTVHAFSGRPRADWYGFFRGGILSGFIIYAVLCLAVILTGFALTWISGLLRRNNIH